MTTHISTALALTCTLAIPSLAMSKTLMDASLTTKAATAEQASLCTGAESYPTPWEWDPSLSKTPPQSATSGTPRIDQVRGGNVIASYVSFADGPGCTYLGGGADHGNPKPAAASGCGPFTREHAMRLWENGDRFEVYPAVYENTATVDNQQPWIGPGFDGDKPFPKGMHAPVGLVIEGVVQNNTRPVLLLSGSGGNNTLGQSVLYIDTSSKIVIRNIDIEAIGNVSVGNSALYNVNGQDITLANMHIYGFGPNPAMTGGANGVISATGTSGYFKFRKVETDHNGGQNGPRHNIYIASSTVDPNFTAIFDHIWSHDAIYGHELKSRAPQTVILNSYLEGATSDGSTPTETYLADVPNGGRLTAIGNVFRKGYSGPNSNGMSLTYGMEGIPDARALSIDIENNTFAAFAATFDGSHPLFPMSFFYPQQVPQTHGFPVPKEDVLIRNNAFAGYCPLNNDFQDFRGKLALTEALGQTNLDYSLQEKHTVTDSSAVGTRPYAHDARQGMPRLTTMPGAKD